MINNITTLETIIKSIGKIHEKKMVHHDFHIGNILLIFDDFPNALVSDMGLCVCKSW